MPRFRLTAAETRRIAEIAVAQQLRAARVGDLNRIDLAAYIKTTRMVMQRHGVGFWAAAFRAAGWAPPATRTRPRRR